MRNARECSQVTTGDRIDGRDGQRVRIATGDIKEQRGAAFPMPADCSRLSMQEFTDLIEYP